MQHLHLTDIEGIVSVERTPNTHQTGHWKILKSAAISHIALKELDAWIQTQPQFSLTPTLLGNANQSNICP